MLSAFWVLGFIATLGLLGVLIADAPAHGASASVSRPDAEPFETATSPVGGHLSHLVPQSGPAAQG
ncbi:hypothetical protein T261_3962 [Streptomyces lydicus]|nr:hypothetical protein T261_3962 [Streptomyces lydicus]